MALIPDSKKEPITYMFDDNEDGETDILLLDFDRDGNIDVGLYDTDYNGKIDVRGEFKKGESEPYRMERVSEEEEKDSAKKK